MMGGAGGQTGNFGHLAQRANPNIADPMQNMNNSGFPNARRNTMGGAQGGAGGGQFPLGRQGGAGGTFVPPYMQQGGGGAPGVQKLPAMPKPAGGGAPQLGNITGFQGQLPGGGPTGPSRTPPQMGGGNMPRPTAAPGMTPPGASALPAAGGNMPKPQPMPTSNLGGLASSLQAAQQGGGQNMDPTARALGIGRTPAFGGGAAGAGK